VPYSDLPSDFCERIEDCHGYRCNALQRCTTSCTTDNDCDVFGHYYCAANGKCTLDTNAAPQNDIVAGETFTCAQIAGNTPSCWGKFVSWNVNAELRDPSGVYVKLFGGANNACGKRADGDGECWGFNGDGQCDTIWYDIEQIVPTSSSICVVRSSKVVSCQGWGFASNSYRYFDNTTGSTQIVETADYGCALGADGTIMFQGSFPAQPSNAPKLTAIAGGHAHVCGITVSDGTLVCWEDSYSTCGAGAVPKSLGAVLQVVTGYDFTCALTAARKVSCWGCEMAKYASVFESLTDVERIAAGSGHACAMQSTGNVVCWGSNSSGQTDVPTAFRR
jgi:hypothetical protein